MGWELMHLLEEQQKRPVFDDYTGADIRRGGCSRLNNDERPQTEDIKNALTILNSRVAKNNLTPRNKDLFRLVGSQFLGEWSKWIKQQVAHRRQNRLSVSGPAEELTPVELMDSKETGAGEEGSAEGWSEEGKE